MRALWLAQQQLSYCEQVPKPVPAAHEALVRVRLAGICATDLALVNGYYPHHGIIGHEFVGEIVAAAAAPERVGERVVGEINIACGHCPACQRGHQRHCQQRRVLGIWQHDGAFADYLCLPLANLIPVPESVTDEAAVFTEPLAAALAIQQQVRVQGQVLIIGAGRLGQLIAQSLALTGCGLQVVARHDQQRQLLTARHIPWLDEQQIPQAHYDIVVEATGAAAGFNLARQAVRPAGTIVVKSTYKGEISLNLSALVVDEIQLVGSRCGPFAPALRLLERQLVDPTVLIEEKFPLSQGLTAFNRAQQPGVLKLLLHTD